MTSSQAPTDGQTQTDAVNRTAQEILAALQAKDSAKVASYYAPNAVLATPGRPAAKDSPRTPGHRRPSAQGSGALPLRGAHADAATSRSSQPAGIDARKPLWVVECVDLSRSSTPWNARVRRWQRRWRKDFRRGIDAIVGTDASRYAPAACGRRNCDDSESGATSNRRQASAYAFSVRRLL